MIICKSISIQILEDCSEQCFILVMIFLFRLPRTRRFISLSWRRPSYRQNSVTRAWWSTSYRDSLMMQTWWVKQAKSLKHLSLSCGDIPLRFVKIKLLYYPTSIPFLSIKVLCSSGTKNMDNCSFCILYLRYPWVGLSLGQISVSHNSYFHHLFFH